MTDENKPTPTEKKPAPKPKAKAKPKADKELLAFYIEMKPILEQMHSGLTYSRVVRAMKAVDTSKIEAILGDK